MNNVNDNSVFRETDIKPEMTIKEEPLKVVAMEPVCILEETTCATQKNHNQISNEVADSSHFLNYISKRIDEAEYLPENISLSSFKEYPIAQLTLDKEKHLMRDEICATNDQMILHGNSESPSKQSSNLEDTNSANEKFEERRILENLKTEHDALLFFQKHGIIPSQKKCQKKHEMRIKCRENRIEWWCSKIKCKKRISIRQNTWLLGSRIPLQKIIKLIHTWAEESGSQKFYQEELSLCNTTIVDFQNYLREVCARSILKQPPVIGGEFMTVEIGNLCFTERKMRNGIPVPQRLIFGGFCRETEDVFLCAVPNTNEETLLDCIKANIRPGSTIISDERKLKIENIEKIEGCDYNHIAVNDSEIFAGISIGLHTQHIEQTLVDLKTFDKRQCGIASKLLDSYLYEFIWRRRNKTNNIFKKILEDIANFYK